MSLNGSRQEPGYDGASPPRFEIAPNMSRIVRSTSVASLLLLAGAGVHAATDLSVAVITAPLSGCALGPIEKVTIRLFNHGDALPAGTRFDVSYVIAGSEPVTESVTLATTLLPTSVLAHTFADLADLSVAGTFHFDASANIANDINPMNNGLSGHLVLNSAPSLGGTVTGPDAAYSGTLMLAGHLGSVRQWEQSTDDGERWFGLDNPTATLAFDELTRITLFRAEVKSGSCVPAYSSIWTVNPL